MSTFKYHHLGIPTKVKREGETFLPDFKLYCSGYDTSPYKIEWMRYEDSAPSPKLVKNNWELAVYPVESQGFTEPGSWTDEYKRIFKLFEQNLSHK